MIKSGFVKDIKTGVVNTWKNTVFLTIDMDWAHDEILEETLEIVHQYKVKTTLFVTNKTKVISKLSNSNYINYGIHPNFKPLILNQSNELSIEKEVSRLMNICPEAKAVRAHALIHGSPFQNCYKDMGLTHELDVFIPCYSGIKLKPYKLWNGLISVPYGWEDDYVYIKGKDFSEYCYPTNYIQKVSNELIVLDFHPIHIFLNTESSQRYESTRNIHNKPYELIKYRYNGYGTRNRFIDTLQSISENK